MESKQQIDIIAKKLDIIKAKGIGFMAIRGSSWVYAVKDNSSNLIAVGAWVLFALSAIGVIVNFLKLGELYKDLEGLEP